MWPSRRPSAEDRATTRAGLRDGGDSVAEALDIEGALLAGADHDGGVVRRSRLRALIPSLSRWWRYWRQGAEIRNCGLAADRPAEVRFAVECPRSWESLEPSAHLTIRTCDTCRLAVHLCADLDEVAARARLGECVAVPAALARHAREAARGFILGRPDRVELWAEDIQRPGES